MNLLSDYQKLKAAAPPHACDLIGCLRQPVMYTLTPTCDAVIFHYLTTQAEHLGPRYRNMTVPFNNGVVVFGQQEFSFMDGTLLPTSRSPVDNAEFKRAMKAFDLVLPRRGDLRDKFRREFLALQAAQKPML